MIAKSRFHKTARALVTALLLSFLPLTAFSQSENKASVPKLKSYCSAQERLARTRTAWALPPPSSLMALLISSTSGQAWYDVPLLPTRKG